MKREDLEKLGLSKEQVDGVLDMHHVEINPIKEDLQKVQDDLKLEQGKCTIQENAIKELEENIKSFKGVDVGELNQKIADLQEDLKAKDEKHTQELLDRDFSSVLKESILAAKGKDAEKIIKLLNVDELKASKNQKEDIAEAIKLMAEDDITKGMFGETETQAVRTGSIIGEVTGGGIDVADAQMRAVMGLPPTTGTEHK